MKRFFGIILVCMLSVIHSLAAPAPKEDPEPEPTPQELEKSKNNLKQFGLAMHGFHDAHNSFPTNIRDKNGKDLLSWRVHLLPYIEEQPLYNQFKLDEPWDSDNNKKLIEKMPSTFAPVRGKAEKGTTFYQTFSGKEAYLHPTDLSRIARFTDGLSNTVVIVEAAQPVIWTKPEDLPFDSKKDLPALGGQFRGDFHALLGDGSVRIFKKGIDSKILKGWITVNGGEVELTKPK